MATGLGGLPTGWPPMRRGLVLLCLAAGLQPTALAQKGSSGAVAVRLPAIEASTLTSMPAKELAVFKDGHAFVLHEGEVPTESSGDVVLDTLPTPVLGTFWAYSADPQAKLAGVVAGQRNVKWSRTALSIRELIEANAGAAVRITEPDGDNREYEATIIGIPKWTPKEADEPPAPATSSPQPPPQPEHAHRERRGLPPANIVLVQTQEGVKTLPIDRIRDITFRAAPQTDLPQEEQRHLLTLKLDWDGRLPAENAKVGMVYLQRGVRWIPNYRIDIDGEGHARIKLQATLINELVDLDGATVHLVIGVPSFYFRDTLDPMALQEAAVQLGQYFSSQPQVQQQIAGAFSNAIMTQQVRTAPVQVEGAAPTDLDDSQITAGSRSEDMFVFTVPNVRLRKGERMVVPVAEFELTYEDLFALDVAFVPPPDMERNYNNQQALELARMMQAPRVMHRIRLRNTSAYPLTTAPAIVLRDGRLLAQSLMAYTPLGATTDVDVTTAVDVSVKKLDVETKRTPDAVRWNNEGYTRVDLAGTIGLTNHRPQAVSLEITRHVLGAVESADHDAMVEKINVFEDTRPRPGSGYPYWWFGYNWPWWWHRFNGIGRITWKLELPPGQSIDLAYTWYYYWR